MDYTEIILHHTGGTDAQPLADSSNYTFDQCNNDHKVRFNFMSSLGYYVGYHYYMDKNGVIKQARTDTEEGAHAVGHNKKIGICIAGNFDATLPNDAQVKSLRIWLADRKKKYPQLVKVSPHRKYAKKTCYGNKLPDTWGQDQLNIAIASTVPNFDKEAYKKDLLNKITTLINNS
jgi:hypothetical protein